MISDKEWLSNFKQWTEWFEGKKPDCESKAAILTIFSLKINYMRTQNITNKNENFTIRKNI